MSGTLRESSNAGGKDVARRRPNPGYAQWQRGRRVPLVQALRRFSVRTLQGLADLGDAGASILSPAQIQGYAANAGFTGNDLATAVAIALAESGGNPNIIGDQSLAPSNGPSYGLWQINIGSKANPQFAGQNLLDPQTNANAAYSIYSRFGFGRWTTYGNGTYGMYLQPGAPTSPDASAPLTIDASTGLPVADLTPTPAASSLDHGTILLWTGVAAGVYLLADVLSDL